MREKETVHLRLEAIKIVAIKQGWMDEEGDIEPLDATLKDLAILFNNACGQGVEWSLAYELSKRLNVPYGKVCVELSEIFDKYSRMTDIEAYDACYMNGHPSGYEATWEYLKTLPEEEIPAGFQTQWDLAKLVEELERKIKDANTNL